MQEPVADKSVLTVVVQRTIYPRSARFPALVVLGMANKAILALLVGVASLAHGGEAGAVTSGLLAFQIAGKLPGTLMVL